MSVLIAAVFVIAAHVAGCNSNSTSLSTNEGFVTTDEGIELYYRTIGAGGDSVIAVHGGPGAGMHTIIPMIKPLAETFTLIFYDQRGGGRSTLPDDTTKLQPNHFVEDLEAVRRHFGLEQMNAITHSFGSVLVAEYAKKYPDRLKRLAFHGSTGPLRSEAGKYYQAQTVAATQSPDIVLSNRVSALLRSLMNGTASDPLEACREYEEISRQLLIARGDSTNYEGTTCNAPPESVLYYYQYTARLAPKYFGAWDYMGDLKDIMAPLLVVYGEQDTLGIPMQEQWIDAVPNSRLVLISGAKKAAFSDNPDEAIPEVVEFFRGNHAVRQN